jgi:KRAB domain-containing zinc finger protein
MRKACLVSKQATVTISFEKSNNMPKTIKSSRVKHQCRLCLKEFDWPSDLKTHMDGVHLGVKFDCLECDFKATTKGSLIKHVDTVHRGIRKFKCNECERSFSHYGNLARHIQSVHNKIRFVCTGKGCDNSYSRQGDLNNHIKSFHEGQEHRCDQCGKVSTTKGALKRHIQTVHSDERRFVCSFDNCEKSFNQNSALKRHIKSAHEGVRYPCSVCDKSFTSRGNLKTHISSVHTKTRYQCDHCEKSFTTRGHLNTHVKRKHQNSTNVSTTPSPTFFNCLFCGHCNISLPEYYQHNIQFHAGNVGGWV